MTDTVTVPREATEAMRLVPDRVLTETLYWMARAYERVHSMPRVSDTELANKIEAAKADLGRARDASPVLSNSAAPAPEGGAVSGALDWLEYGLKEEWGPDSHHLACIALGRARAALATREEAPDWTARTEAAWAENNREDAPAAGEREIVAKALARIKGHRDVNAVIWLNEPQIEKPAWEFYLNDADVVLSALRAQPQAREDAQPTVLPTDETGQITKRFVIFTTPGEVPEKKGGWLKDEHLIDFLRSVMLHDDWKPGFRATVLELTWDNDLWASSATEYLSMHDEAIGPRRARKAWQEARAEHERIYKAAPKMKLGAEIDSYRKATAIPHPAPDALRGAVEALTVARSQAERGADKAGCDGWRSQEMCRQIVPLIDQALAALQAEQGVK